MGAAAWRPPVSLATRSSSLARELGAGSAAVGAGLGCGQAVPKPDVGAAPVALGTSRDAVGKAKR